MICRRNATLPKECNNNVSDMDLRLGTRWGPPCKNHPSFEAALQLSAGQAFQSWNENCGEARPKQSIFRPPRCRGIQSGGQTVEATVREIPPISVHWSLPNLLLQPSIHFFCNPPPVLSTCLHSNSLQCYFVVQRWEKVGPLCFSVCSEIWALCNVQCTVCSVSFQCTVCEAALRIIYNSGWDRKHQAAGLSLCHITRWSNSHKGQSCELQNCIKTTIIG